VQKNDVYCSRSMLDLKCFFSIALISVMMRYNNTNKKDVFAHFVHLPNCFCACHTYWNIDKREHRYTVAVNALIQGSDSL
jgi:hypothetical protein